MAYFQSQLFHYAIKKCKSFKIISDMTRNNETDPKFAGARIMKQYLDFAKGKPYETIPKLVFSADGDKNIKKLKDHGIDDTLMPTVTNNINNMIDFCLK